MHAYDLILTITGGLAAALCLGYFTQRLGLSPIVGYLLAGTLVGPHTPGFVADSAMAEQLAEIGVILLMFGVGLQFHVEELLAVRRVAIPGAIAQSAAATVLGAVVAHAFGWTWSAGFIFGMALGVASTVVLIRVLADNNDLHTQAGHIQARPALLAVLDRSAPVDARSYTARRSDAEHRAVVVGYGPTGRTVVRLLRDNDITPTVIDLNIDAVRELREDGIDAVYGDAMRPETLEAAGVPSASHLILGSAGMASGDEVIRLARQLNPGVRVLARTEYVRDVPPLKQAGATAVYSGEGEVGLAFVGDILAVLGATPEQIDRERLRARVELFTGG